MSADVCAPVASAAMNFSRQHALIIDLRDYGGGEPAMVTFIVSSIVAVERLYAWPGFVERELDLLRRLIPTCVFTAFGLGCLPFAYGLDRPGIRYRTPLRFRLLQNTAISKRLPYGSRSN